jgi:hypothetical protein
MPGIGITDYAFSVFLAATSISLVSTRDAVAAPASEMRNCSIETSLTIRYDGGTETSERSAPQECTTISQRADTGDYGTYTFTTSNPSFLTRDNNGSFSAQVTYNASRPVAFGFVIAEHLDALAAGPVTANVDEFVNNTQFTGCNFGKVQPISYSWHWSCPSHVLTRNLATGHIGDSVE